jgi:glycosyltransferase involved in cell wall biosynthesis
MLLIAYQQPQTIARAIRGALAQTYSPLEIVISDDASNDGTFAAMQAAVAGYTGPHRIVLNRNPVNLGIGAHLSHLVGLATGELLFVAAGDDVSLPQRCETVVRAWLAHGRRTDLIASALTDMDDAGGLHAPIVPTELQRYRTVADWLANPPFVVGAAQAWTRRLFERFGPLPAGVVAEDLIMVFRAIGSGGALTLPEPLVGYGRGGISRRVRNLCAQDVIERVLKNNRHALVEHEQLLRDARLMGQLDAVQAAFDTKLKRERFIRDVFAARGMGRQFGITLHASGVPTGLRLRMLLYAALPGIYAPFFFLKRRLSRKA